MMLQVLLMDIPDVVIIVLIAVTVMVFLGSYVWLMADTMRDTGSDCDDNLIEDTPCDDSEQVGHLMAENERLKAELQRTKYSRAIAEIGAIGEVAADSVRLVDRLETLIADKDKEIAGLRSENERLRADLAGTMEQGGFAYFQSQRDNAEREAAKHKALYAETLAREIAKDKENEQMRKQSKGFIGTTDDAARVQSAVSHIQAMRDELESIAWAKGIRLPKSYTEGSLCKERDLQDLANRMRAEAMAAEKGGEA